MSYTYPPAPATLSGDDLTISRFLQSPTLVARRLRTLAEQRFVADVLLSGRFDAAGGSVVYETSESIFSDDDPEAVAPGSAYPETGLSTGAASIANTVKWGQDALVTDEAIARRRMQPVNRALTKLVNQIVQFVDTTALSAISSAITQTTAASAAWSAGATTARSMLDDLMQAKATILANNEGYMPNVAVMEDDTWAYAIAAMGAAGFFSRESDSANPLVTGEFPTVGGLVLLPSPNIPTADTVIVADSEALGGMADENLGGPGYTGAAAGVQAKSIREDKHDRWRLRARRVTVPVVTDPAAGFIITGV